MPKHTPLYNEHIKLGARMVEFAGWEMPVQYSGVTDEHLAVRTAAGLFDVSHMGIFEISGPDAVEFLDYLTPSNNQKLADGQAQYSLFLTAKGTIIDDIIIYRISAEYFLMVVNAINFEKDYNWVKKNLKGSVEFKTLNHKYAILALQGPRAVSIISKISSAEIEKIKAFHLASVEIKGVGEVILARTGYTGEDGFEIFVENSQAANLWDILMETGKEDGIKPVGLGARDTLRLEMKYTLYGHEISEDTNALEAGLRWVIKFKKRSDFIGKDALKKIKEEGLKRKLIGFKMIDRGIPRDGYAIMADGRRYGHVTSGTFSPSLKMPIGIGYVDVHLSEIGTQFSIDIRGKERLAEVVKTPFYKKGDS